MMAVYARRGNAALSSQTLEHFVVALATNDRKGRRAWVSDDEVLAAIRGYVRCFTAATGTRAQIPHEEIEQLLSVYRRRRGLLPPMDAFAQGVLFVSA
jgi:hypothetical protein